MLSIARKCCSSALQMLCGSPETSLQNFNAFSTKVSTCSLLLKAKPASAHIIMESWDIDDSPLMAMDHMTNKHDEENGNDDIVPESGTVEAILRDIDSGTDADNYDITEAAIDYAMEGISEEDIGEDGDINDVDIDNYINNVGATN